MNEMLDDVLSAVMWSTNATDVLARARGATAEDVARAAAEAIEYKRVK